MPECTGLCPSRAKICLHDNLYILAKKIMAKKINFEIISTNFKVINICGMYKKRTGQVVPALNEDSYHDGM